MKPAALVTALAHSTAATSAGAVGCPPHWCTHSMAPMDASHESSEDSLPQHAQYDGKRTSRTSSPQCDKSLLEDVAHTVQQLCPPQEGSSSTCSWPSLARNVTATQTLLASQEHQEYVQQNLMICGHQFQLRLHKIMVFERSAQKLHSLLMRGHYRPSLHTSPDWWRAVRRFNKLHASRPIPAAFHTRVFPAWTPMCQCRKSSSPNAVCTCSTLSGPETT